MLTSARLGRHQRPHVGLGRMTIAPNLNSAREPGSDIEQKQIALGYLLEAWSEARLEGVDGDCLAQASLFSARSRNSSPPMARTRPPKMPKACPRASAMASSRCAFRASTSTSSNPRPLSRPGSRHSLWRTEDIVRNEGCPFARARRREGCGRGRAQVSQRTAHRRHRKGDAAAVPPMRPCSRRRARSSPT